MNIVEFIERELEDLGMGKGDLEFEKIKANAVAASEYGLGRAAIVRLIEELHDTGDWRGL